MSTQQKALTRVKVSESRFDASQFVRAGFSRTLTALDGVLLSGATPRGYRREGYPEIEWHQIMAGRRDRFEAR